MFTSDTLFKTCTFIIEFLFLSRSNVTSNMTLRVKSNILHQDIIILGEIKSTLRRLSFGKEKWAGLKI